MAEELTLVILKPDALEKSLTGIVIYELAAEGLTIVGAKIVQVSRQLAEQHYEEHQDKPFFPQIVRYLQGEYHTRKKVMALVYHGDDVIERIRRKMGPANPLEKYEDREPIAIRQRHGQAIPIQGDDGRDLIVEGHVVQRYENVIHGSDPDRAEYEVKLWFQPEEILEKARIYPTVERTLRVFDGDRLTEESKTLRWATSAKEVLDSMNGIPGTP